MCGRYTLTRHDDITGDLQASLDVAAIGDEWWKPRYNVAPTQPAPVVRLHHGPNDPQDESRPGERAPEATREIVMMRWGLVPFWAGKPGAKPPLMINARKESLHAKAVFRDLLARRRCLVPADGFYEWKPPGKGSKGPAQPVYLHPEEGHLVAFAGLWARARTKAGEVLSFTIITGPANALVKPFHDRMPVVLDPSAYAAWLDPSLDGDGAFALLDLPPVGDWIAERVSTHVNKATNDDPDCIVPIQ